MSGRVGHRKRLICVNAANLRANHLYPTGHGQFVSKHDIKPGDALAIDFAARGIEWMRGPPTTVNLGRANN